MMTSPIHVFRALLLVAAISAMAACGSRASANEPSSNARTLARVAELSAIAHYANEHGLIGGSPTSLRPAPVCQGLSPASASNCSSSEISRALCADGRYKPDAYCDHRNP